MIVDVNTPPEKNLYYLGAMLLKCLLETEDKKFDINQLYKVFSENEKISFVLFSYTLDWLFMLSLVRVNDKGEIVKCF